MIDVKAMIRIILREAASKDEAGLKADIRGNAVLNMLMSANGQASVPQQNHPSNKGKLVLNYQLN
jgi:hypothetical protein